MVITYEKPGRGELPIQDQYPIPPLVMGDAPDGTKEIRTDSPMNPVTAGHLQHFYVAIDEFAAIKNVQFTGPMTVVAGRDPNNPAGMILTISVEKKV
jgi:hypothetical protein